MWLQAQSRHNLIHSDAGEFVHPWRIDVCCWPDVSRCDGPDYYVVGRLLADEIRRLETLGCGEDPYEVADADSQGLLEAYTALCDDDGDFQDHMFRGIADPIVYLYRFELHEDFANWRVPLLDAFSRLFPLDAIILAQHHTTWLSFEEFELAGFRVLPKNDESNSAERTTFMIRDNRYSETLDLLDYPEDSPAAAEHHQDWLQSRCKRENLC